MGERSDSLSFVLAEREINSAARQMFRINYRVVKAELPLSYYYSSMNSYDFGKENLEFRQSWIIYEDWKLISLSRDL